MPRACHRHALRQWRCGPYCRSSAERSLPEAFRRWAVDDRFGLGLGRFLARPAVSLISGCWVANGVSFIVVPTFYSVLFSYRLIAIPDHLQGRVQSVFRLLSLGSQPLGLVLTGLLIQWIGPGQTVVLLFVPQALIALFATLNRRLRAIPLLSELARKEPG